MNYRKIVLINTLIISTGTGLVPTAGWTNPPEDPDCSSSQGISPEVNGLEATIKTIRDHFKIGDRIYLKDQKGIHIDFEYHSYEGISDTGRVRFTKKGDLQTLQRTDKDIFETSAENVRIPVRSHPKLSLKVGDRVLAPTKDLYTIIMSKNKQPLRPFQIKTIFQEGSILAVSLDWAGRGSEHLLSEEETIVSEGVYDKLNLKPGAYLLKSMSGHYIPKGIHSNGSVLVYGFENDEFSFVKPEDLIPLQSPSLGLDKKPGDTVFVKSNRGLVEALTFIGVSQEGEVLAYRGKLLDPDWYYTSQEESGSIHFSVGRKVKLDSIASETPAPGIKAKLGDRFRANGQNYTYAGSFPDGSILGYRDFYYYHVKPEEAIFESASHSSRSSNQGSYSRADSQSTSGSQGRQHGTQNRPHSEPSFGSSGVSSKAKLFNLIGLDPATKDFDMIKKAVNQARIKFHPDKNREKSPAEQKENEEKFKQLDDLWKILKNKLESSR